MEKEKRKLPKIPLNLGTIVFSIVIIYLLIFMVISLSREKLAVYEVSESEISDTFDGTGVIVRDEQLFKSTGAGYVNYSVRDGSRVAAKGTVYALDSTGELSKYVQKLKKKKSGVDEEEKQQLLKDLKDYSGSFTPENFREVYNAGQSIDYDLTSYTDTIIAQNRKKIIKKFGKNAFKEVKSKKAGIVSYRSDGYENLSVDTVTDKTFSKKTGMKELRSDEKIGKGTGVYRLIRGQKWQLVIPVSEDDYGRIENLKKGGTETIKARFFRDGFEAKVPFELKKSKNGRYVVLNFEDYIQRYVDERFLNVELELSHTSGYMIPASSLVDKEVYKIPGKLLFKGSDSNQANHINLIEKDENGVEKQKQIKVEVYHILDDFAYISTKDLQDGMAITDPDWKDRFTIAGKSNIQGVFCVNRGFAEFYQVSIILRNEDYCIVSDTESKIRLYDRIILNSGMIEENEVIY